MRAARGTGCPTRRTWPHAAPTLSQQEGQPHRPGASCLQGCQGHAHPSLPPLGFLGGRRWEGQESPAAQTSLRSSRAAARPSPACAQGPGPAQNPGSGLNVKVPRHGPTQGHGPPEGCRAHLLSPRLAPPPPSTAEPGTRVTGGGAGSGLEPTARLLLPAPEPGQRSGKSSLSTDGHRQDQVLDADQRQLPGHGVLCGSAGTESRWQATPGRGG